MPEGDRFERIFRAGWRSAYQYTRDGRASEEEIVDKLVKSLARNLREASGIPGFSEMAQLIAGCNPKTLLNSYEALDRIVREHNGHRHAKIAADVAKSLIVQSPSGTASLNGEVSDKFAERVCDATLDSNFFAKAGTNLVEEGVFSNLHEFREWQEKIERLMEPSIAKIADHLVQTPDAKGLRAPNRISTKKPTGELLEENLLSI